MVETFFKTIKSELVRRTVSYIRAQAEQAVARYIDGFYHPVRRHFALDHISPAPLRAVATTTRLRKSSEYDLPILCQPPIKPAS